MGVRAFSRGHEGMPAISLENGRGLDRTAEGRGGMGADIEGQQRSEEGCMAARREDWRFV